MIRSRRRFLSSAARVIGGGVLTLLLPERLIMARRKEGAYLERAVYAMGTTVSVSVFGRDRHQLIEATSRAFRELSTLEDLLSVYKPSSDIGRLNAYAGCGPVSVDPRTAEVLHSAKRFHRETGGSFDVTIERLMEWWGFRASDQEGVTREGHAPLGFVGDRHLRVLDETTVVIDKAGVKIDTGGIAVGYAVDRMTEILRNEGIVAGLINHGGDVYAIGAPEDSDGWSVVIPHPGDPNIVLREVGLRDTALSTSTNARSRRTAGHGVVGHILDPRTGRNPSSVVSTSILAPSSIEADALSTAGFVRDPDEWMGTGHGFITLLSSGEHRERLPR